MKTYEYEVTSRDMIEKSLEDERMYLQNMNAKGWQLVSVILFHTGISQIYYFKRELASKDQEIERLQSELTKLKSEMKGVTWTPEYAELRIEISNLKKQLEAERKRNGSY